MTAIARIDRNADLAARRFTVRVAREFDVAEIILFGSRVRGDHRADSDVDLAVLLRGHAERRVDTALRMAAIAFDVLLETGVMVEAVPLWEEEWAHPARSSNPDLIDNIRREGIRL